jgi:osmotically-inducible protein OsmY
MKPYSTMSLASAVLLASSSVPLYADMTAPRSDAAITAEVSARLHQDSKLSSRDPIAVRTRNGEVTLSGKLATVPMIYRAVQETREVTGVHAVDDDNLTTFSR